MASQRADFQPWCKAEMHRYQIEHAPRYIPPIAGDRQSRETIVREVSLVAPTGWRDVGFAAVNHGQIIIKNRRPRYPVFRLVSHRPNLGTTARRAHRVLGRAASAANLHKAPVWILAPDGSSAPEPLAAAQRDAHWISSSSAWLSIANSVTSRRVASVDRPERRQHRAADFRRQAADKRRRAAAAARAAGRRSC